MKIRLKYIQSWADKKTGKVYAYFRRPGFPRIQLPGTIGSVEFFAGYKAALAGEQPATAVAIAKQTASLIESAIERYLAEALPARVPSPSTRARQTSTLNTFAEKFGAQPVTNIDTIFIKNQIKVGPNAAPTIGVARTWLITVREFCKWAVEEKLLDADPTAGIVIKLPKSDGHAEWTEKQVAQFEARWPLGTRERLLFSLLLHTGQRCSDVRLLGPSSIVKGAFPIKQQKTGAEVVIPVHPELAAAIKACNVVSISGFFLTTKTGKPLDQRDLNKWFRKACDEAGLPDTCVPHGLRKTMCRRLAQRNVSTKLIAAVSGHKTLKEIERYTKGMENEQGARDAFALLLNADEAAE